MPIYTYHCSECKHDFEELLLSRGGEGDVVCAQCGSQSVERRQATFAMSSGRRDSAPSCDQGSCSSCPYGG